MKDSGTKSRKRNFQILTVHVPRQTTPAQAEEFKRIEAAEFQAAFHETLQGKASGVLTPHLFHAPSSVSSLDRLSNETYMSLKRRFGKVLYGGLAWDEHVMGDGSYAFPENDLNAIKYAIEKGLAEKLPAKNEVY